MLKKKALSTGWSIYVNAWIIVQKHECFLELDFLAFYISHGETIVPVPAFEASTAARTWKWCGSYIVQIMQCRIVTIVE
jgi:hypothetical protein